MASVDKDTSRKKTPWVVRWRDETGRQRKKGFVRKVDADRFRAEIEHRLNVGSYIDPALARTTFQTFAEQWRASAVHRPNTAARVLSQLTVHAYPAIGHRPLGQLRTSELQAFVTGLPLKASSARSAFATVQAVLAAAVRDRMISFDPSDGVKLPEMPHTKVVPLTIEQVGKLTAAMPARYRALVVTGAGTGLRQGELFGLQVRDVNFLKRTLVVERQVQTAKGGGPVVVPLKNKYSYRDVPVGRAVIDTLAAHLAAFPAAGDEHIFTGPGGLLHRGAFGKAVWTPGRKAAGMPAAGMHDLRHFYASLLIRAGMSPKVVAARLGHKDAAMTLNVYSHLWPDDEDRSREAVDAVLLGADVPTMRPAAGS